MFVDIPNGVSVRKLDESRLAQHQKRPYKYSAWYNGVIAYGNSLRGVIKRLREITEL